MISVYSIERGNEVLECIKSIKKQTLSPKEIIVVLDPDKNLVSYYKKHLDSSVKLLISESFGLSFARNSGVRNSTSTFIAFIDDDALADANWLNNIVEDFSDSTVIGIGGRIIPVWPGKDPDWFPEELFWIVGCSYKGLPTEKEPIRNPIGCNMAFRRSAFDNVGLFNDTTGRIGNKLMGHDDTEFGIRATNKLSGTKIIYDINAVVYHKVAINRANLKYVCRRSYSEGFSKAFLSNYLFTKRTNLKLEKNYLLMVLRNRAASILNGKFAMVDAKQLIVLFTSLLSVLLGYLNGKYSK